MSLTAEELHETWRENDRFIGTGFACDYYARRAKDAVKEGLATEEIALAAYDLATGNLSRWHEFHRPMFGKDLEDENRRAKILPGIADAIKTAASGSVTQFLIRAAGDYYMLNRLRDSDKALHFAQLRSPRWEAKKIVEVRALLGPDLP